MSKDINLLPDVTLKEEKESKQQKLLTIVSMAILIIGIVGIIGAFTIDITFTNSYKKITEENIQTGKEILDYADTESYQRAIKSKLTTAGNIIKAGKDYKTIIENIQNLVPETGVTISDLSLDKADKVTLNAKSDTTENFKVFYKNILDKSKGGIYFDEVTIGSVSTTREGALQFNVSMKKEKNGGKAN